MRMVLIGPPGSGKGTQSKLLTQEFGVPHISSGDLLREAVEKGTELGKKAKGFMDSGALVPDELVLGLIAQRIGRSDCQRGFLLDGFPRNVAQGKALEAMLAESGCPLDHVVALEVPRAAIIERLSGRRLCPGCGRLYHVKFDPPAGEGKCDDCGKALLVRDDDREETVAKRLDVYEQQTAQLLDFYRNEGLLRLVVGSGTPQEVADRIRAAVATAND